MEGPDCSKRCIKGKHKRQETVEQITERRCRNVSKLERSPFAFRCCQVVQSLKPRGVNMKFKHCLLGKGYCCGKYELVVRFGTAAAQEEGLTIDGRRLESVEEEFGEVDWDNVPQPFASNFKKLFSSFQVV